MSSLPAAVSGRGARGARWGAGRVSFTSRSLLHDRVRLAISLGGMTFAVVLVLLLRAIMDGTIARSTSYIDHVGADVFIARTNVTNMSLASSILPESTVGAVGGAAGVKDAAGIIRVNMIATSASDSAPAQFVGYPLEPGLGGPWKMAEGRRPEASGEAVVDTVLADELDVGIGDSVGVAGREFRVVGMSSGTASIAAKFLFVPLADAQEVLQMSGSVSFVLVDLEAGIDPAAFALATGDAYPELSVMTREELSKNDRELLSSLFIGPINVMSTVGLLVGLAIVGLTMYTTTNERIRDFGVLKAIGAPNRYLFRVVVAQSLVVGSLGFVFGLLGTWAAGPVVQRGVPDIAVAVDGWNALRILGAVILMSLLGALVPVLRIVRVDPLVVFRR